MCNLMKLRTILCTATEDGWVIGKSSDRAWSTGGGNHNPPQCACPKNPMNSVKRQKDMAMEDEPPLPLCGSQQIVENCSRDGNTDHHTCLRNLYVGQEATVRIGHGTMDWFKTQKAVRQGSILSPCLFNSYAGYTVRNARLNESQTAIKIAGRIINNLRYAYDTTLMTESEEELRSLLMRVKRTD